MVHSLFLFPPSRLFSILSWVNIDRKFVKFQSGGEPVVRSDIGQTKFEIENVISLDASWIRIFECLCDILLLIMTHTIEPSIFRVGYYLLKLAYFIHTRIQYYQF